MSKINIHKVGHSNTSTYKLKKVQLNNRPHLVAPVVMMVEGVHVGSKGAIFHSIDELGKFTNSWDGMPVMIKHPTDAAGDFISANALAVAETCIGRTYNTRVEGKRLKADVYMDEAQLKKISPTAMAYLLQGKPLEVSVGVFTDSVEGDGEWDGEAYAETAVNYRPDHLALLPGEKGACSWDDGCGIRTNQATVNNPQTNQINMEGTEINVHAPDVARQLAVHGMRMEIMTNAQGMRDRLEEMDRAIANKNTSTHYNYMEELYDSHVIYRLREDKDNKPAELYKQSYNVHADGTIELTGDPVKVRKEINYITVNSINNNQNNSDMDTNNGKPCVRAKVDKLIANTVTKFGEDDREWLMQQEEAVLDKLEPAESAPPAPKPVEVNAEHIRAALKNVKTSDEFLEMMPDGLKDQMQSALTLHADHRKNLITQIMANAKEVWPEEDLQKMNIAMLQRIASTAAKTQVAGDTGNFFMGNPPPQVNTGGTEEDVLMPLA